MSDTTDDQATSANTVTIMVGSYLNMDQMISSGVVPSLVANGDIGLDAIDYDMAYATYNGSFGNDLVTQLVSSWYGSGSGTQEMAESSGVSSGTTELTNTTTSAISVSAQGAVFAAADGVTYQTVEMASNTAWTSGAIQSGNGSYVVQAGQTITVPIEATFQGDDPGSDAAGSITTSSIAGLTVTQPDALTAGGSYSDPEQNDEGGWLSSSFGEYGFVFSDQGLAPAEAHVSINGLSSWTAADVASWDGYVDNARSAGILNVAPLLSGTLSEEDPTQPFATSGFYAGYRSAITYGGGLEIDLPPYYWLHLTPSEQQTVIEEIRWCSANGLRSSILVSNQTDASGDSDLSFATDTVTMLQQLQAEDALPSQIVFENDNSTSTGPYYDADAGDVNSLNAAALDVASDFTFAPSASEAGLEVKGTAAAQTTLIMTGVLPSADLASGSLAPYVATQLFSEDPTETLSLIITDTTGLLSLSDSLDGASVGPGGTLAFSGTAPEATAFLNDVEAASATGAAGIASLELTLTDYLGDVTDGVTSVYVGSVHPIITSVTETSSAAISGMVRSGDAVIFALSTSAAVTVVGAPELLLTNESYASYVGQDSSGDLLFSYTVGASDDTVALRVRGLRLDGGSIMDSENGLPVQLDSIDAPEEELSSSPTLVVLTDIVAAPVFSKPSISSLNVQSTTVSGTGVVGTVVTISDGVGATITSTVEASGIWTANLGELAAGTYSLTAVATDTYGTVSQTAMAKLIVSADLVPVPSFAKAFLTSLNVEDTIVSGMGVAGDQVTMSFGVGASDTAIVTTSGAWSVNLGELTAGTYSLTAVASDSFGTVSQTSASTLVVSADVVSAPLFSSALIFSTNVHDTTVSGTGVAGDMVTISDGVEGAVSATVTASGAWSVNLGKLAVGTFGLSAVTTDSYGTVSSSTTATLEVSSDIVAAPLFASATKLSLDGRPTFAGTGAAGSTIILSIGSLKVAEAVVSSSGTWSATVGAALSTGTYVVVATAADAYGSVSTSNSTAALTVVSTNGNSFALQDAASLGTLTTLVASTANSFYTTPSNGDLFVVPNGLGYVAVTGGSASSTIVVGDGTTLSYHGSGDATIIAGSGSDTVLAGAGNDTIALGSGKNDIVLGTGNSLVDSSGTDTIVAGSGVDTIDLMGSSSTVYGGYGTSGYAGTSLLVDDTKGVNDLIFTAAKGAVVDGSNVTANGMSPNVTTVTAFGDATVYGGAAVTHLFAGNGAEITLTGSTSGNILVANDGLWANGNYVDLNGSKATGSNQFWAGSGNSTLIGGTGSDTLVAGAGDVTISGGSGATNYFDFFASQPGGNAVITDFAAVSRNDIVLFGYGAAGVTAALNSAQQEGTSTVFGLGDGTTIVLENFKKASLTASHFLATSAS